MEFEVHEPWRWAFTVKFLGPSGARGARWKVYGPRGSERLIAHVRKNLEELRMLQELEEELESERLIARVRKNLEELRMLAQELEEVAYRYDHRCQQAEEEEAELYAQERYWDTEMEKIRILEG